MRSICTPRWHKKIEFTYIISILILDKNICDMNRQKRGVDRRYRLRLLELLSLISAALSFGVRAHLNLLNLFSSHIWKYGTFADWASFSIRKNEFAPARKSPEKFRFALYCGVDSTSRFSPERERELPAHPNFMESLWAAAIRSGEQLRSEDFEIPAKIIIS